MSNPTPLPVLRLVAEGLHDVFGNLGGLVRIAWPYYALATLFAVLGLWLAGGGVLGDTVAALVGGGTAQLILSLAVVACIVAWQRHVLVAAPLSGIAPLNGRVLRYVLWSFLLTVLCCLPILASGLLGAATGLIWANEGGSTPFSLGTGGVALLGLGAIISLVLFVRLNLVLPAISADDPALGLRRAWALTERHGLRLCGLFLLLLVGLWLLGALAGLAEALVGAIATTTAEGDLVAAPSPAAMVAGMALNTGLDLLTAMIGASITARVYRQLVPAAG